MLYIDILHWFKSNTEHYKFIESCLNHVQNINTNIQIDDDFISTVYKLCRNKNFDFKTEVLV